MKTIHCFNEDDAKQALKIVWRLKGVTYDDIEINRDLGLFFFILVVGLMIGLSVGLSF